MWIKFNRPERLNALYSLAVAESTMAKVGEYMRRPQYPRDCLTGVGKAFCAGLDMVRHCDIRLGCETTRFFTYQNVGQIAENGALYLLPRIVGMGRELELFYTRGFLEADEAYRWGLLNHLYSSDELEEKTR